MRVLISTLLLFAAASCAKSESSGVEMNFNLAQEETADPSWIATWNFSKAVNGLNFSRQNAQFRSRAFEILTPGVRFQFEQGRELLVSDAAVSSIQVRLKKSTMRVENDYAFLLPLGKNGAVIYAGHFAATPFDCEGDCANQRRPIEVGSSQATYKSKSDLFIYADRSFGSGQRVITGSPEGFVYFGKVQAVETPMMTALVDPNLPDWAIAAIKTQSQIFLNHFSSQMVFALKEKPTLLISYSAFASGANDSYGAVVGNNVVLAFEGKRWSSETPETREDLLHLMAHETFHLWNGSLFTSPEREGGAWLHEGSAEAMAWRTLLDLGLISRTRYIDAQNESLNRCAVGREMFNSLSATADFQKLRSYYDCGAAMHFLMQASARARGTNLSLYTFWRSLFMRAGGTQYTHEMFFDSAQDLVGSDMVQSLKQFSQNKIESVDSFFLTSFQNLGIPTTTLTNNFPGWYQNLIRNRTLESFVDRDCNGRGYFNLNASGAEILGSDSCANFKSNRFVYSIEGLALSNQSVEAYDQAQKICESGATNAVNFQTAEGPLQINCAKLFRRPQFIALDHGQVWSRVFDFDLQ